MTHKLEQLQMVKVQTSHDDNQQLQLPHINNFQIVAITKCLSNKAIRVQLLLIICVSSFWNALLVCLLSFGQNLSFRANPPVRLSFSLSSKVIFLHSFQATVSVSFLQNQNFK